MSKSKKNYRTVGRQKMPPETVFWIVLVVALALGGAGFWLHNNILASTRSPEVIEQEEPAKSDSEEDLNDHPELTVEEPPVEIEAPDKQVWTAKPTDSHTSILLLGLDNHGLSDLIMVLSYDMETYESSLISIKRDTFVHKQLWAAQDSGLDHLTFAHYYGMGPQKDFHAGARLAAGTIEDMLGIELHAYVSITFEGFISLVDLIGGVVIDVAPQFAQREGGALPVGRQRLNGEQALTYARHRQNPRIAEPGSTSQDEDRIRRNQRLLKAIFEQCKTLETDELLAVADQLENKLYTSLEDWDILTLANILYNRDPAMIKTVILPGESRLVFQEQVERDVYYYFLNFEESDRILKELGLK